MFRQCLNRGLDREGETLPKLRANVVIPCPRLQQILICFWNPDDRERHGFLNRPALTCSQGAVWESLEADSVSRGGGYRTGTHNTVNTKREIPKCPEVPTRIDPSEKRIEALQR
jgi:hypothetical protein